ncbi:hypothetical protein [Nocardioides jejuensis]|uniref:Uncharacterized protein n=1 Tax=Nocardioides jejuensis TaxID=2502782 RepID=A0A4R1C056_9ACTN|nr:hypothetical protein [Nocardioides jejuensis]TCJ23025.1 hypothetical protein EPD65_11730 [Nocardioides jejuensis]
MAEQNETEAQKLAREQAAWRRADTIRALEEERVGYERYGRTDRVEQVDAALRAAKSEVKERKAPEPAEQTTTAPTEPVPAKKTAARKATAKRATPEE